LIRAGDPLLSSPLPAGLFAEPFGTYLDTASYGLAPLATVAAVERALQGWSTGEARWFADWDPLGEDCRRLIGSVVGVDTGTVALMPAVSVAVSIVMSGFPAGAEVLVAADEFNSVLLPLLAAERERGLRLRLVPYAELAAEITDRTALVALSHVRSNGGGTQSLERLVTAARARSAAVLVDVTHSAGILPVDAGRLGIDFVVGAAYKHLLAPRGVAFLAVREPWWDRLAPRSASWRGQADPLTGVCGGDLDALAPTAARFDVSLDWLAWVGAKPSLELITSIPGAEREAYCVGLATAFAEAVGAQATGSSIVGVPVSGDREAIAAALDARKVRVTVGDGTLRVSFHLYNTADDLDRAVSAIRPFVRPGG
jgi:selenocysteine lyase/cysteine desulfurase